MKLVPFPVDFSDRVFILGKQRQRRGAMTRIALSTLFLLLLSSGMQGQQLAEVSPDSYDVYSALISNRLGHWFNGRRKVFISPRTVQPTFSGCSGRISEKSEQRIEAKLRLPGPYQLANFGDQGLNADEKLAVRLSPVVFDQNRREATVWLEVECGKYCREGLLFRLVKNQDGWRVSGHPLCGFET
jgi:hypothetical protein